MTTNRAALGELPALGLIHPRTTGFGAANMNSIIAAATRIFEALTAGPKIGFEFRFPKLTGHEPKC